MNTEEKLSAIRAHVVQERIRRGIIPGDIRPAAGPSDADIGEFYIFVERDLMRTKEDADMPENPWHELKTNFPLLDGAYRYVTEGIWGH